MDLTHKTDKCMQKKLKITKLENISKCSELVTHNCEFL